MGCSEQGNINLMEGDQANSNTLSGYITSILGIFCGLAAALILANLIIYSENGLDFTDEGFYLNWVSDPFFFNSSVTLFGFIYHPLHNLMGEDIVNLRQANIVITFLVSCLLTFRISRLFFDNPEQHLTERALFSMGIASSSLLIFSLWLITPNYNTLNFQAISLCALGVLMAERDLRVQSVLGCSIVGISGVLVFMAKPTSAILLGVCVVLYLYCSGKLSREVFLLIASVASSTFIIIALLVDGSIHVFAARLESGYYDLRGLSAGNPMVDALRIDDVYLDDKEKFGIFLIGVVQWGTVVGMRFGRRKLLGIGFVICLCFFAYTVALTLGIIGWEAEFSKFQGFLFLGQLGAMLVAVCVFAGLKIIKRIPAEYLALALFLALLPNVFAFGSNNNYWQVASWAAFFWLLPGLVLLAAVFKKRQVAMFLLSIALITEALTITMLQTALDAPYRQPKNIRDNAHRVDIGSGRGSLLLSKEYAEYLSTVLAVASSAGFEARTPVIDLSGQSPGVLFAIGAQSVGLPWLIGGYPGSLKVAESVLARVPCDTLAEAWILSEPDGPRQLSSSILFSTGLSFPVDYLRMGTWWTAAGAGGYAERRRQELYRPLRPQTSLYACAAGRNIAAPNF